MFLPDSKFPQLSPNQQALPLVENMILRCEELRIKVHKQKRGTVIDCGVQIEGSLEAGSLFAAICLGGLAKVSLHWRDFSGLPWPAVEVLSDHPVLACLASQYAGWPLNNRRYSAMASGPGRSIIHEGSLFHSLGFEDHSETAILCLESGELPPDEVIYQISERLQCAAKELYILVAPTASLAGSVQIAARALETGLSKLFELDYDLGKIVSGWGICPLPPSAGDNRRALGRTNDAILYGSTVLYNLRDEDEVLNSLVRMVPSCFSPEYGRHFEEIYQDYGDFYDIDPLLFSPAEVWLCNMNSGHCFHAGSLRPDILGESFGLQNIE